MDMQKRRLSQKRFRDKLRANKICTSCRKQPVGTKNKTFCDPCAVKHAEYGRALYQRDRDAAFEAYGGWKCACCGELEKLFLTLEHIGGGGGKHRKKVGAGNIYRWLRTNNYPTGYEILCANCNQGRRVNNGVCPHVTSLKLVE